MKPALCRSSPAALGLCVWLFVNACAHARDGMLDTQFIATGHRQLYYGLWYVYPGFLGGAGIQSTGRLVFANPVQTSNNNWDFGVTPLNPDGTTTDDFGNTYFGSSEFVAFDRGGKLGDYAADLVVLPDDSIVVAGTVDGDSGTGIDFAALKLSANGAPDSNFGNSGKAIVPFNLDTTYNDDYAVSVSREHDGKILMGGNAATGQYTKTMAIARLTDTGERDGTFNTTGRVTIGFGGDLAGADRVRELADHQHILVVGYANTAPGANTTFALARLNESDGSLDANFGSGGKTTFNFPFAVSFAEAFDFGELPDGRLLVCGTVVVNLPINGDTACMRFLATGAPDPSYAPYDIPFDLGGILDDASLRMQVDAQGRFLLVGYASTDNASRQCTVARLTAAGALDPTFGSGGRLTPSSALYNDCGAIVLQPDGKIVVAGHVAIDSTPNFDVQVLRLIGDTIFSDTFE
jgi:uncharacterized delta-60 repeat protein